MTEDLKGKNVLVSGAGKGIGRQIALSFAQQGSNVAFFDVDIEKVEEVDKQLKEFPVKSSAQVFDITRVNEQEQIIAGFEKITGKVNTLINNVGVGLVKKFFETNPEDFDKVFTTNLKGPFFLTQLVAKKMRRGDSIIFISSIHSDHPSLDPTYDGAKAAINNLVANLALELAPKGIRVNAVSPGHIDIENQEPRNQDDVPLDKKAGLPKDIAEACLFLADEERSGYVTGAVLPVTGGLHIPIAKDIKF